MEAKKIELTPEEIKFVTEYFERYAEALRENIEKYNLSEYSSLRKDLKIIDGMLEKFK